MANWVYEARNSAGKVVQGAYEAPDRRTALEFLREQGLFLTRLEAKKGSPTTPPARKPAPTPQAPVVAAVAAVSPGVDAERSVSPISENPGFEPRPVTTVPAPAPRPLTTNQNPTYQNPRAAAAPIPSQPLLRASSKDLAIFFRQTGAMIHAGTSIGTAMNAMAENAPNEGLRRASAQIERRAMSGEPMSESMRAFPGLFSPLQIGMVSAGERGGFLDSIFERLTRYSERDYELQQMIKAETWYPKLLVAASIFIPAAVPFVLAMVMPGRGNPILAWLGSVLPSVTIVGLLYAIYRAADYASPYTAHQNTVKLALDGLKLKIPIVGKVTRGLATAKFCRALGALTSAGVGVGESVKLASHACGNSVISRSGMEAIPHLEHGEKLTDSLARSGHFPKMVLQMLRVGEESGSIDTQLDKAADFLENDSEMAIKQSIKVLGILVFLLIAIRIGFQVGSFYIGYFNDIFKMAEG